jgi:uncharacterized DUF497 family protein
MPWESIIWTDQNQAHIAEHGVSMDEVEQVLQAPQLRTTSRSTGLPIVIGYTAAGRLLAVVFEEIDSATIHPITAYEPEE